MEHQDYIQQRFTLFHSARFFYLGSNLITGKDIFILDFSIYIYLSLTHRVVSKYSGNW